MPKNKRLFYKNQRQEMKTKSVFRASRFTQKGKGVDTVIVKIGDKEVELTDLSKLISVVDTPFSSVNTGKTPVDKGRKSKRSLHKKIEYAPLSEFNSAVFGAIPDKKNRKSNLKNISDIVKSIIR